jgi:hypothetical protein
MVIFFLLSISVGAKPLFAEIYNKEKIYRYLKSQQSPETGLVDSFTNTSDEMLLNQASTYDQALAVMAFLLNKDAKSASRILDFFDKKWNGVGFANFYNTKDGDPGIEGTIHLGPNAWIALAALQYDALTGQKRYEGLSKRIAAAILEIPHDVNGGVAMGPMADWGADWRNIFSAENNIDALVVFRHLEQLSADPKERSRFGQETQGIKQFLKEKIFSRKPRVPTGPEVDWMASDVLAFSLLAFNPSELECDFGITPLEMFSLLEKNFLVETDDIVGYDFADFLTKQSFDRKPMISIEWSAMVALAYLKMSDYYQQLYALSSEKDDTKEANKCLDKGKDILDNLDKKVMPHQQTQQVYPYATKAWEQVFPFAPWWRTPQRGEQGRLAGSLSGTCWRMFAEEKFNPFNLVQARKR